MLSIAKQPLFEPIYKLLSHPEFNSLIPDWFEARFELIERKSPFPSVNTKMASKPSAGQIFFYKTAAAESQIHEVFHVLDWSLRQQMERSTRFLKVMRVASRCRRIARRLNAEKYFFSHRVESKWADNAAIAGAKADYQADLDNFLSAKNIEITEDMRRYSLSAQERFARYFVVWSKHRLGILSFMPEECELMASRSCSPGNTCNYCAAIHFLFSRAG